MLQIKNLHAEIDGQPIIQGLNLSIGKGEVHAIMGPNGAGKSTLAKILAGHPDYEISQGSIFFEEEDLCEKEVEERTRLGLFVSFQYPPEIPGLSNIQFLREAVKGTSSSTFSEQEFSSLLDKKMNQVQLRQEFKHRYVNEGFSGGEKKRNELLQMAMLNPKLAILDEADSGLDIDAVRFVGKGIRQLINKDCSLLLITHYQRLLDYITPDFVHVLVNGKIVQSGTASLAKELEKEGYANAS